MALYRDQAVVLRTIRLGEADRIVTFLTSAHGKVSAVAKGVRKTKSRFGGRLEPTGHVALLLYRGRDLDVVTQVDALEQFRPVREDLERLAKAHTLLEVTDQVAQERQSSPRLYQMLVGALRALAAHDAPLLVPAFFLKLLACEGFEPVLDRCAGCQADDELVGFDLGAGGALCRPCARPAAARPVSPEALGLMRDVLGGGLVEALARPAGAATAEVERVATAAVEHHLERRLRSMHVLDRA